MPISCNHYLAEPSILYSNSKKRADPFAVVCATFTHILVANVSARWRRAVRRKNFPGPEASSEHRREAVQQRPQQRQHRAKERAHLPLGAQQNHFYANPGH